MRFNKFTKKAPVEGDAPDKRKIKAVKREQDGLKFDSTLELYMYNLLKDNNITFVFKPKYTLQEGFTYRHELVRPMTLTPDFLLEDHNIIIDTKGFSNETSPLRYKMLKHQLFLQGREYRIEMPSSQKKCRELIESIKRGYFMVEEPISEAIGKSRKKALMAAGFEWRDGQWGKKGWIYDAGLLMSMHNYDFQELLNNSNHGN